MPTHAGNFRTALLGSTTARVLNSTTCPVLTTKHAEAMAPRPLQHRDWLCAIGAGGDSEEMLRYAARAASAAGARLSVIHAIPRSEAAIQRNSGSTTRRPLRRFALSDVGSKGWYNPPAPMHAYESALVRSKM
jgi:hypothetical protein